MYAYGKKNCGLKPINRTAYTPTDLQCNSVLPAIHYKARKVLPSQHFRPPVAFPAQL